MDKTHQAKLVEIKARTSLSEVALAQRLGVSQPTVNRIRNGQGDCKGSTLIAIDQLYAEVFGSAGGAVQGSKS
ncbi:helix-turn-helix transcriptional regulator [Cupriavidus necator]|uniref:helix-turn-helix domain-containing protein n=1 Tax=Cupriavidus necator TaxID=106590 RepID=UPI003ECF2903